MADREPEALRGCLEACDRCLTVLDTVPAELFTHRSASGSIGAHLRHCLDHMTCLIRGLPHDIIEYDRRERSPRLETDPEACRAAFLDLREGLKGLTEVSMDRPIEVLQTCAPGAAATRLPSSVARELAFVSSHTIHHLSLIEEACAHVGVALPEGFSLAYSTAAYRCGQSG